MFDTGAVYLSEDILEPFVEIKTPLEAFQNMQFDGIEDFKRIIAFQRLNGDLTNMFYSMTNSLTEYLPHQFLPVTKFLQSPEERILIADEVGLGKTVEAMYIWKELEARRNAKILLVVCTAALREWAYSVYFRKHCQTIIATSIVTSDAIRERISFCITAPSAYYPIGSMDKWHHIA